MNRALVCPAPLARASSTRAPLCSSLALALFVVGCQLGEEDDTPPPPTFGAAPLAPPPFAPPPAGMTPMTVALAQPSMTGGYMVMLTDQLRSQTLPIYVGDAEGSVIDHRIRGQRFVRPMTHDLLDDVVRRLGARVTMIEIDEITDDVFYAHVTLWDGRQLQRLDARSSDAIALALGNGAPIYVSQTVLAQAAIGSRY